MRRWLGGGKASNETAPALHFDELHELQDAMKSTSRIINDEVDEAEAELGLGTSPFHKLGIGLAVFLRATLGFEKEVIEQAKLKIQDAEEAAIEYQKLAVQNVVGSETESMKGFFKLRKAYSTLYRIREAEEMFLRTKGVNIGGTGDSAPSSTPPGEVEPDHAVKALSGGRDSSEDLDDFEFVDAPEVISEVDTPSIQDQIQGKQSGGGTIADQKESIVKLNKTSESDRALNSLTKSQALDDKSFDNFNMQNYTSDVVDLYIHAGTSFCFGLLQLLVSMIPPAFSRILSLFSFRGDRQEGLNLLWAATRFKTDINGAMAGLITLAYYNTTLAYCDIVPKNAIPQARLRGLLQEMREIYPKSKLWIMEEARMLADDRKLEQSIHLLSSSPSSSSRQIEAIGKFEMALQLMFLHRYEECATTFIECCSLNNWSHALYYYIAGACYVELYRKHKTSNPEQAEKYGKTAEQRLREVPDHLTKKRFLGRQLPINGYVERKITKWETRATARSCRLVDAVGVSPIVEMIYFWSGMCRMRPEDLKQCLERLEWSEAALGNSDWESEADDEKAIHGFLVAACQRFLGDISKAQNGLKDRVLTHELTKLKACENPDLWPLPLSHYELAVCSWISAGGENGDRAKLLECSAELSKMEKWESFELEARFGLKVTTARNTLQKCGINTR